MACLRAAARDALRRNARRETQRILSARGQLKGIEALAHRHGIRLVVLKGGLHAARGVRAVDLVDVDLLVRSKSGERLASLLQREGYRAAEGGPVEQHLAPLYLPGGVPVEIHTSLKHVERGELRPMWSRIQPVKERQGLSRLAAVDHLWYLVLHSGLHHPHRRGSLRDLLLICEALNDCTADQVRTVDEKVREHPERQLLHPVFDTARRLQEGLPAPDLFGEVAAANYLFVGRVLPSGIARSWSLPLSSLVFQHLGESGGPGPWSIAKADVPSARPFLAAVEERMPRMGRWIRRSARLGRLAILDPPARWIARAARVAVRRAGEGPARPERQTLSSASAP